MEQTKKTKILKSFRFLLLIPAQLLISTIVFYVLIKPAVSVDVGMMAPGAVGHPVPVFSGILTLAIFGVTVAVLFFSVIATLFSLIDACKSKK